MQPTSSLPAALFTIPRIGLVAWTIAALFTLVSLIAAKGGRAFQGIEFARVDMRGATLRHWDFTEANLAAAIFRDTDLRGADFKQANLARADMASADMRGAIATGANFARANLHRANLQAAQLQSANLVGANLKEANLAGANLAKANLQGATLTGATFDAKTVWPSGFSAVSCGAYQLPVERSSHGRALRSPRDSRRDPIIRVEHRYEWSDTPQHGNGAAPEHERSRLEATAEIERGAAGVQSIRSSERDGPSWLR